MSSSYKSKFRKLVKRANNIGLCVKLVPDKETYDYVGMNPEAAKMLDFPCPRNTIMIDNNMTWRDKCYTLNHEIIEYELMSNKNCTYGDAHRAALKLERKI